VKVSPGEHDHVSRTRQFSGSPSRRFSRTRDRAWLCLLSAFSFVHSSARRVPPGVCSPTQLCDPPKK